MSNSKLENGSAPERSPLADVDKARLFQSLQIFEKKKQEWSTNTTDAVKKENIFWLMMEIRESLSTWSPWSFALANPDLVGKILKTKEEEDCPIDKPVGSFWLNVLDPVDSTIKINTNLFHPTTNEEKEEALLFLILNHSNQKQLSFDKLKGKDRLFAQLFQCCPFLEVHLVLVTRYTSRGTRQDFEFEHQWIDVNNRPVELKNIKVDFMDKLIGEPGDCLSYLKTDDQGKTVRCYQQVALVIWSKKQTDRIYCQYGFSALLSRICGQSEIGLKRHLVQDLNLAVGFCQTQPLLTWNKEEEVILILLKNSNREQGLALLNLSGIESLFNDQIAKAIAKFVLRVAGWADCSTILLKLVALCRLPDQLAACANLSLHLKDGGCCEGAVQVANVLFSFLVTFSDDFQPDESVTKAFFKLVVILETDPSTASQQRVDSLVVFFSRLPPYLQSSAIVLTGKIFNQLGTDSSGPAKDICKRLCAIFPSTVKLSVLLEGNSIHELNPVVNGYLQLEELSSLQILFNKICKLDSPNGRNRIIQSVLSSKENWSLLSSSIVGRELIHQLLLSRITALAANTNLEDFRRSLFCCLLHVIQLDEIDSSLASDPLRVQVLGKFLETQLPIESACHFINDLGPHIRPILSPPIKAIISSITKNFNRSNWEFQQWIAQNYKLVLETLFIFARAGKLEMIVESICNNICPFRATRKSASRLEDLKFNLCKNFNNRTCILKYIMGTIWSSLSSGSRNLVRKTCYQLITARFLKDEDLRHIGHKVYNQFEDDLVSCINLVFALEISADSKATSRQESIHVDLLRSVRFYFIEGRVIEKLQPSNVRSVLHYFLWLANNRQDLEMLPLVNTFVHHILSSEKKEEFVSAVLSSQELEQLVTRSAINYRLSLCRLVDERLAQLARISSTIKNQEVAKLEALSKILKFNGPPAKKQKLSP